MHAARIARLVSAVVLVGGLASFAGCQLALKADTGDLIPCDLPQGQACPGRDGLQCIDGACRPPPGCVPHPEVCNGVDDDCDGKADEPFDKDADGYPTCGKFDDKLNPIPNTSDCNDNDPAIHPGVEEVCNGADDNCNGLVDEEPNNCSDMAPPELCWTNHKDASGSLAPICIPPGDCRFEGCKTGGCDPATGKCTKADCVTDPTVCPAGTICDPKSRTCLQAGGPGDKCDTDAQCTTRDATLHCIDSGDHGTICTKACCASEDCPTGTFCRAGSNGTDICLKGSDAGLTLGSKAGNDSCSTGADCRSGVCTTSKCVDSCCGSLTCGSGGTCALRKTSFTCGSAPGSGNYNDSCSGDSNCKSGVCMPGYGYCTQHCCASSDCPDGRDSCQLFRAGTSPVTICAPFSIMPTHATKKGGDTCGGNGDCRGGTCTSGHCDDFCCHDADCGGGWVCKPKFDGTYSPMKCVAP